jgi:hypothetical protein
LEASGQQFKMKAVGRTTRAGRRRGVNYHLKARASLRAIDRLGDLDLYFHEFVNRRQRPTPEQALQSAVMEQAIHDLRSPDREIVDPAHSYVCSDDVTSPFSFIPICLSFRIDHRAAREALGGG